MFSVMPAYGGLTYVQMLRNIDMICDNVVMTVHIRF